MVVVLLLTIRKSWIVFAVVCTQTRCDCPWSACVGGVYLPHNQWELAGSLVRFSFTSLYTAAQSVSRIHPWSMHRLCRCFDYFRSFYIISAGFPLKWKPGKLLEFYVRPGIFGI